MKKNISLCTLILILILIFSISVNAVNLKDVPKDHWAYKSVKKLVEKGYLTLYEDGTFKGTNKVSRYELAELVARVLEKIQTGQATPDKSDVKNLRKLSIEFREELVDLAEEQKVFSEKLKKQQQTNVVQTKEIGKVNEKLNSMREEVSKIIDSILQIKEMKKEINNLNQRVVNLEKQLNQTNQRLEEKQVNIESLKERLNNSVLKDLRDQNSITQTKIHSLQSKVNELENKLSDSENGDKSDNKKMDNSALYLAGIVLLALVAGS